MLGGCNFILVGAIKIGCWSILSVVADKTYEVGASFQLELENQGVVASFLLELIKPRGLEMED